MRHLLNAGVCIAAIACAATPAFAQETTSSIRGTVSAPDGTPVAGATVTVIHVPSGTKNTAVTDAGGNFTTSGLRVGGPFEVDVAAEGFAESSVTDIQLTAGQPLRLPIALETGQADIVVTAAASGATDLGAGPTTVLNRRAIEGVASTRRDIRDIVRRDPMATIDPGQSRGVIIAGQNARLNKFSVDGLRFSDNFGLNVGGLPTTRGPVPLDAIEQLSVKVAPYDISEGDFQGGAINLVLRSGGNKFTGSGFYTYNDDGLTGSQTKALRQNLDFTSKNYGGFLSGPIIKDTLFFALSYERLEESQPTDFGVGGVGTAIPNLTSAQVDQIGNIAQSVYNYATGGVYTSVPETDEKYTAKVDWNITTGQRLSFTYIHNEGSVGSTSGFSTINAASPALTLASNNYLRPEIVNSFVGELNSEWTNNFSTQIRGNYRKYDLTPVPFGAFPFSQFQVCLDPSATAQQNGAANTNAFTCSQGSATAPGAARVYFGPDQFRHFNYVRTKQYGGDVAVKWNIEDLSFKLTGAWEHYDIANAFAANALGTYYFDSIADLQARRAGSVVLQGSISGNLNDILASFQYDQFTVGAQAAWDPSSTFNITAGYRADLYAMNSRPLLNQAFFDRYKMANTGNLNGKISVQPRLSSTWTPIDRLKLRAGVGLFAGGSPDVFVGNSFSVNGVLANSVTIQRNADGTCTAPTATICTAALTGVTGTSFSGDLTNYLRTNTGAIALSPVNALDPGFKLPSTWKSSLSADYKADLGVLGDGWNIGGDVYYGWTKNAAIYYDLRLRTIGVTPDGRPRYASTTAGANTDLWLTNSDRGHSLVTTARFDKQWPFGLSIGGSYTYQDIKDQSSMNGTTGSGTYGQNPTVDANVAAYGTSIYQIRHSWKFNFDFDHAFFGDNRTRFSLFGELRSGLPYSLTMTDLQSNGHGLVYGASGATNRNLLYVPSVSDTKVVFDSAATETAFNALVGSYGLGKYRGTILKKNSHRSANWFKVDLHVDQEVPLPLVPARVTVFADMENVLNFIDKDWGALQQVNFPYLASVVTVSCVASGTNACAQYRYSNFSSPTITNQVRASLWALRIGAKLKF